LEARGCFRLTWPTRESAVFASNEKLRLALTVRIPSPAEAQSAVRRIAIKKG